MEATLELKVIVAARSVIIIIIIIIIIITTIITIIVIIIMSHVTCIMVLTQEFKNTILRKSHANSTYFWI
jgi:hypothetical protein